MRTISFTMDFNAASMAAACVAPVLFSDGVSDRGGVHWVCGGIYENTSLKLNVGFVDWSSRWNGACGLASMSSRC